MQIITKITHDAGGTIPRSFEFDRLWVVALATNHAFRALSMLSGHRASELSARRRLCPPDEAPPTGV